MPAAGRHDSQPYKAGGCLTIPVFFPRSHPGRGRQTCTEWLEEDFISKMLDLYRFQSKNINIFL